VERGIAPRIARCGGSHEVVHGVQRRTHPGARVRWLLLRSPRAPTRPSMPGVCPVAIRSFVRSVIGMGPCGSGPTEIIFGPSLFRDSTV